jgi:hypothetical protein
LSTVYSRLTTRIVFPPTRQVVPLGDYTRPIASAAVHDATNPQPGNCVEGLSRHANRPRRWTIENQAPGTGELVGWPKWWAARAGQCVAARFEATPVPAVPWLIVSRLAIHRRPFRSPERTLSDPEWPWALAGQVDNRGRAIGSPGRPCARGSTISFWGYLR